MCVKFRCVGFKFSPGNSKKINRYRGQAAYTTLGALIGRFYDYNAYIDGEWESIFNSSRIEKAIGKKTLEDLKHLIPENVYFEKLIDRNLTFSDVVDQQGPSIHGGGAL